MGESPAEAAARIEEAKKTATDLTGLIRKKAKPEVLAPASTNGTNGKRKAEDEAEETDSKKAKVNAAPKTGDAKQAKVEDDIDE